MLLFAACGGGSDAGEGDSSIATRSPVPTTVEGSASTASSDEPSTSDVIEGCPIAPKTVVEELIGVDYEILPGGGADPGGALCQFKRISEDYVVLFITADADANSSKAGRISYLEQADMNAGVSASITDIENLGDEAFSRLCCDGEDRISYSIEAFRGPLYVRVVFAAMEVNPNAQDSVREITSALLSEF